MQQSVYLAKDQIIILALKQLQIIDGLCCLKLINHVLFYS